MPNLASILSYLIVFLEWYILRSGSTYLNTDSKSDLHLMKEVKFCVENIMANLPRFIIDVIAGT